MRIEKLVSEERVRRIGNSNLGRNFKEKKKNI